MSVAIAATDMIAHPLVGSFPAGHSSPVGFTPAQIKHAYGFDAIHFTGGIVGDGSGQTIAVIEDSDIYDAHDQPGTKVPSLNAEVRF